MSADEVPTVGTAPTSTHKDENAKSTENATTSAASTTTLQLTGDSTDVKPAKVLYPKVANSTTRIHHLGENRIQIIRTIDPQKLFGSGLDKHVAQAVVQCASQDMRIADALKCRKKAKGVIAPSTPRSSKTVRKVMKKPPTTPKTATLVQTESTLTTSSIPTTSSTPISSLTSTTSETSVKIKESDVVQKEDITMMLFKKLFMKPELTVKRLRGNSAFKQSGKLEHNAVNNHLSNYATPFSLLGPKSEVISPTIISYKNTPTSKKEVTDVKSTVAINKSEISPAEIVQLKPKFRPRETGKSGNQLEMEQSHFKLPMRPKLPTKPAIKCVYQEQNLTNHIKLPTLQNCGLKDSIATKRKPSHKSVKKIVQPKTTAANLLTLQRAPINQSALPLPAATTLKKPIPVSIKPIKRKTGAAHQITIVNNTPQPNAIVLEDKVLSQHEKIDLNSLRLLNGKQENVTPHLMFITSASAAAREYTLKHKHPQSQHPAPILKRSILLINKLKQSSDNLAILAKVIKTNQCNLSNVANVTTIKKKIEDETENKSENVLPPPNSQTKYESLQNYLSKKQSYISDDKKNLTSTIALEGGIGAIAARQSADSKCVVDLGSEQYFQKTNKNVIIKPDIDTSDGNIKIDSTVTAVEFVASLCVPNPKQDIKLGLPIDNFNFNLPFTEFTTQRVPNEVENNVKENEEAPIYLPTRMYPVVNNEPRKRELKSTDQHNIHSMMNVSSIHANKVQTNSEPNASIKHNSFISEKINESPVALNIEESKLKPVSERLNLSASDSSNSAPKRFKKVKVNLVQRNKKSTITNPTVVANKDVQISAYIEAKPSKESENVKNQSLEKLPQISRSISLDIEMPEHEMANKGKLLQPKNTLKRTLITDTANTISTVTASLDSISATNVPNFMTLPSSEINDGKREAITAEIPSKKQKLEIGKEGTVSCDETLANHNEENHCNLYQLSEVVETRLPYAVNEHNNKEKSATEMEKCFNETMVIKECLRPQAAIATAIQVDTIKIATLKNEFQKINSVEPINIIESAVHTTNLMQEDKTLDIGKSAVHKTNPSQEDKTSGLSVLNEFQKVISLETINIEESAVHKTNLMQEEKIAELSVLNEFRNDDMTMMLFKKLYVKPELTVKRLHGNAASKQSGKLEHNAVNNLEPPSLDQSSCTSATSTFPLSINTTPFPLLVPKSEVISPTINSYQNTPTSKKEVTDVKSTFAINKSEISPAEIVQLKPTFRPRETGKSGNQLEMEQSHFKLPMRPKLPTKPAIKCVYQEQSLTNHIKLPTLQNCGVKDSIATKRKPFHKSAKPIVQPKTTAANLLTLQRAPINQSALPLPAATTLKKPIPVSIKAIKRKTGAAHQITIVNNTPQPNAIVLEDKVLSQHEKIDLTSLGLRNVKQEPVTPDLMFNTSASAAAREYTLKHKHPQSQHPAPILKRSIFSTDKLKQSSDNLAILAKVIKTNQCNLSNVANVTTIKKKIEDETENKSENVLPPPNSQTKYESLQNYLSKKQSYISDDKKNLTSTIALEGGIGAIAARQSTDAKCVVDLGSEKYCQKTNKNVIIKPDIDTSDGNIKIDSTMTAVEFVASLCVPNPKQDIKLGLSIDNINFNLPFTEFTSQRVPNEVENNVKENEEAPIYLPKRMYPVVNNEPRKRELKSTDQHNIHSMVNLSSIHANKVQTNSEPNASIKHNSFISEKINESPVALNIEELKLKPVSERLNLSASDSSNSAPKRFKKAKVNLVQRNKKSTITNPTVVANKDVQISASIEAKPSKESENVKNQSLEKLPQISRTISLDIEMPEHEMTNKGKLLQPKNTLKRTLITDTANTISTVTASLDSIFATNVPNFMTLPSSEINDGKREAITAEIPSKKQKLEIGKEGTVSCDETLANHNEENHCDLYQLSEVVETRLPNAVNEHNNKEKSATEMEKCFNETMVIKECLRPQAAIATAIQDDTTKIATLKNEFQKINSLETINIEESAVHKTDPRQEDKTAELSDLNKFQKISLEPVIIIASAVHKTNPRQEDKTAELFVLNAFQNVNSLEAINIEESAVHKTSLMQEDKTAELSVLNVYQKINSLEPSNIEESALHKTYLMQEDKTAELSVLNEYQQINSLEPSNIEESALHKTNLMQEDKSAEISDLNEFQKVNSLETINIEESAVHKTNPRQEDKSAELSVSNEFQKINSLEPVIIMESAVHKNNPRQEDKTAELFVLNAFQNVNSLEAINIEESAVHKTSLMQEDKTAELTVLNEFQKNNSLEPSNIEESALHKTYLIQQDKTAELSVLNEYQQINSLEPSNIEESALHKTNLMQEDKSAEISDLNEFQKVNSLETINIEESAVHKTNPRQEDKPAELSVLNEFQKINSLEPVIIMESAVHKNNPRQEDKTAELFVLNAFQNVNSLEAINIEESAVHKTSLMQEDTTAEFSVLNEYQKINSLEPSNKTYLIQEDKTAELSGLNEYQQINSLEPSNIEESALHKTNLMQEDKSAELSNLNEFQKVNSLETINIEESAVHKNNPRQEDKTAELFVLNAFQNVNILEAINIEESAVHKTSLMQEDTSAELSVLNEYQKINSLEPSNKTYLIQEDKTAELSVLNEYQQINSLEPSNIEESALHKTILMQEDKSAELSNLNEFQNVNSLETINVEESAVHKTNPRQEDQSSELSVLNDFQKDNSFETINIEESVLHKASLMQEDKSAELSVVNQFQKVNSLEAVNIGESAVNKTDPRQEDKTAELSVVIDFQKVNSLETINIEESAVHKTNLMQEEKIAEVSVINEFQNGNSLKIIDIEESVVHKTSLMQEDKSPELSVLNQFQKVNSVEAINIGESAVHKTDPRQEDKTAELSVLNEFQKVNSLETINIEESAVHKTNLMQEEKIAKLSILNEFQKVNSLETINIEESAVHKTNLMQEDKTAELSASMVVEPMQHCDKILIECMNAKISQEDEIQRQTSLTEISETVSGKEPEHQEVISQPVEVVEKSATISRNVIGLKSWLTPDKATPSTQKNSSFDKIKLSNVNCVPPKKRWELKRQSHEDFGKPHVTASIDNYYESVSFKDSPEYLTPLQLEVNTEKKFDRKEQMTDIQHNSPTKEVTSLPTAEVKYSKVHNEPKVQLPLEPLVSHSEAYAFINPLMSSLSRRFSLNVHPVEHKSIIQFSESYERKKTYSDSDAKSSDVGNFFNVCIKSAKSKKLPGDKVTIQNTIAAAHATGNYKQSFIASRRKSIADWSKPSTKIKFPIKEQNQVATSESVQICLPLDSKKETERTIDNIEPCLKDAPAATKKRPGRKKKCKEKVEPVAEITVVTDVNTEKQGSKTPEVVVTLQDTIAAAYAPEKYKPLYVASRRKSITDWSATSTKAKFSTKEQNQVSTSESVETGLPLDSKKVTEPTIDSAEPCLKDTETMSRPGRNQKFKQKVEPEAEIKVVTDLNMEKEGSETREIEDTHQDTNAAAHTPENYKKSYIATRRKSITDWSTTSTKTKSSTEEQNQDLTSESVETGLSLDSKNVTEPMINSAEPCLKDTETMSRPGRNQKFKQREPEVDITVVTDLNMEEEQSETREIEVTLQDTIAAAQAPENYKQLYVASRRKSITDWSTTSTKTKFSTKEQKQVSTSESVETGLSLEPTTDNVDSWLKDIPPATKKVPGRKQKPKQKVVPEAEITVLTDVNMEKETHLKVVDIESVTHSLESNYLITNVSFEHTKQKCMEEREPETKPIQCNVQKETEHEAPHESDLPVRVSEETATPVVEKKKRGRKPKIKAESSLDDLNNSTSETPVTEKKKVGRKAIHANEPFNPRLLLIKNRAQLDTDEVLTVESNNSPQSGNVQCGLCLEHLKRDKWVLHLSTHYGIGWIVNEMTPVELTLRNNVLNAMVNFIKSTGGKFALVCRMCQRSFRSALGALGHIEWCGAEVARIACQFCNQPYSKLGLAQHERLCATRRSDKGAAETTDPDGNSEVQLEDVYNNVGRVKRVSVLKAEKLLKVINAELLGYNEEKKYIKIVPAKPMADIEAIWLTELKEQGTANCHSENCLYKSENLQDLHTHYNDCLFKVTDIYKCVLCKKKRKSYVNELDALAHVRSEHQNLKNVADFEASDSDFDIKTEDQSSEDDDDSSGVTSSDELLDPTRAPAVKTTCGASIARDVFPARSKYLNSDVAKLWREFISRNFSEQPLFTDFKPSYNVKPIDNFGNYLPSKNESMNFFLPKKSKFFDEFGTAEEVNWCVLQRYQSTSTQSDGFFFVGAPIKKLAWVPLPANVAEQYVLLSYRTKFTRLKHPKPTNEILLLCKITTPVAHEDKSTSSPIKITLQYAIHIPEGTVHCMSFLPSGGYHREANRLGLVALGTTSSDIKIYALPIEVQNEDEAKLGADTNENLILIEPKVAMVLTLGPTDGIKKDGVVRTQCLDLCWSEASEHLHIFAAYENGRISYWDIKETMNLWRTVVDKVPHFYSVNIISTGERRAECLALHYDTSGVRWLAVNCGRRNIMIYDLQKWNSPSIIKKEHCKDEITSLDWPFIWESLMYGVGDTLTNIGHCVYALSPVNKIYNHLKVDIALGAVVQLHYNPQINVTAYATANGDLTFLATRELYYDDILPRSKKNCKVVSMMDMKCLNGEAIPKYDLSKEVPPGWKYHDEGCKDKYGIVFGSMVQYEVIDKKRYLSEKRKPPSNLLSCCRINAMRWNLNEKDKQLIAIGYENGFLCFKQFERKKYFD